MLGGQPVVDHRPKLAGWWSKVQERPAVQKVLGEQQEAVMEFQQSGSLS